LIGILAVASTVAIVIAKHEGVVAHVTQLTVLVVISAFSTAICYLRERRARELVHVRTVSEAAQRAVLRPLPVRSGRYGWRRCTWPRMRRRRSAVICTRSHATARRHG
jgi:hypothetical protein